MAKFEGRTCSCFCFHFFTYLTISIHQELQFCFNRWKGEKKSGKYHPMVLHSSIKHCVHPNYLWLPLNTNLLFLRYLLSLKDRGKSHHLEKNTVIIKAIIPFLIVLYCLDLVSHKDLCLSFQGLQIHNYHTLLIPSKS